MYTLSPDDPGAPTATKKDALFDWQYENDGKDTVDRFGGVQKLIENFGTDEKKVATRGKHDG